MMLLNTKNQQALCPLLLSILLQATTLNPYFPIRRMKILVLFHLLFSLLHLPNRAKSQLFNQQSVFLWLWCKCYSLLSPVMLHYYLSFLIYCNFFQSYNYLFFNFLCLVVLCSPSSQYLHYIFHGAQGWGAPTLYYWPSTASVFSD